MDKRGVSGVISAILLILLAIAAVIIVWGVIRGMVEKGAEDVDLSSLMVNMEIEEATYDGTNAYVRIKRGAGAGDVNKIKIVFTNESDATYINITTIGLRELETKGFNIQDIWIKNAIKVEIYPVFIINGKEKTGGLADSEELESGSAPPDCIDECSALQEPYCDGNLATTCQQNWDGDLCWEWGTIDCGAQGKVCNYYGGWDIRCEEASCPDGTCEEGEVCAADCSTETWCEDGVNNDEEGGIDCGDDDCTTGACDPSIIWSDIFSDWLFNEGIGTTTCNNVHPSNCGIIYGASWVADNCRSTDDFTLYFDGSDDYIDCEDHTVELTNQFTFSARFKLEEDFDSSSTTTLPLFSKYNSATNNMAFVLAGTDNNHNTPGKLYFKLENPIGSYVYIETTKDSWAAETWYYVTVTFDGTNGYVYVDSLLDGTIAASSGNPSFADFPVSDFNIGGDRIEQTSNNYRYFKGIIDNVQIHSKALTIGEVSYTYLSRPCDL